MTNPKLGPLARNKAPKYAEAEIELAAYRRHFHRWMVALREAKGETLGWVELAKFRGVFDPDEEYMGDDINLGFQFAKAYWGHGYAAEAARAVLAYAFGTLNLHRVVAYAHKDNARSVRLLEKLGFQQRALRPREDMDGRECRCLRSWQRPHKKPCFTREVMSKTIAFASTLSLVVLMIVTAVYLRGARGSDGLSKALDPAAVVKEIRPLNELVTVRYGIEKVVGMKEDKSPVGTESILLLVQGKVLAGVDLADLHEGDVVMSGDVVHVHLPPPHIQEAFLDEKNTKVWDRSITWWTPWVSPDVDLEHKARLQALEDVKKAALDMGILGDAQKNAEADIRGVLRAFGFARVEFGYGT